MKPASDISLFPLVPRGPLGRLCSHLAKRGRAGFCDGEGERAYTANAPH